MGDMPFTLQEFKTPVGREMIMVNPGNWTLFPGFKRDLKRMYNFEVREDDVWLVGTIKSGNTWASEMIWTLCNDADTKKASEVSHFDRWCFPEMRCYEGLDDVSLTEESSKVSRNYYKDSVEAKSPRFIRSHLPLSLLPPDLLKKAKVVYIYRDPKDCAVSYYHMVKGSKNAPKGLTFSMMVTGVCSDLVLGSPWPQHIKEGWEQRDHPNMFFISYEEMKQDLPSVMRRMAKFFNKPVTENQIKTLQEHLSVDSMRKNKNINMNEFKNMGFMHQNADFIRKGTVGDWKNYFTPEIKEMWQRWLDKYLAGTELKAKFDLTEASKF